MAKTEKLILELVVKNQQALGKLNTNVNKLQASSLSLGKVVRAAVGAFAALGAIRIGRFILTTASQFQDLRVALSSVTGSIENGRRAFNFILDFAKSSIFEVADLTNTFIKLKGAGIEPTTELLTLFQDVASVTTDRIGTLQAITDLFARTTAGGLGLEDLNRLADRGIPVFDMLSKTLGVSRLEISKVGQTTEGAKLILDALSFSLNRAFGGAAANLTTNYSQAVSNLNDAFSALADNIGAGFLPQLTKIVKDTGAVTGDFNELGGALGIKVAAGLSLIAEGAVLIAQNFKLIVSLGIGLAFIKLTAAAIRAAGAIYILGAAFVNGLLAPGKGILNLLKKIVPGLTKLTAFVATAAVAFEFLEDTFDKFDQKAKEIEKSLGEDAKATQLLKEQMQKLDEEIKDADGTLAKFRVRLKQVRSEVTQAEFVKAFDELDQKLNLIVGTIDVAKGAFFTFTKGIGDAVAGAIVDAKNLQQALSDLARTIARELISGLVSLSVQILVLDTIRPVIERIRDAIFKQ